MTQRPFSSAKFLYELFWRQDWYFTQSIVFGIACYDEIGSCRFGTLYLQAILKVSKHPIFQSCAQLLSINSLYLQNAFEGYKTYPQWNEPPQSPHSRDFYILTQFDMPPGKRVLAPLNNQAKGLCPARSASKILLLPVPCKFSSIVQLGNLALHALQDGECLLTSIILPLLPRGEFAMIFIHVLD